jgi:uncharacterized protein DUF6922
MTPEHLRPFFWDVDAETFEPTAHPAYTISRILELGDQNAVRWLRETFPEDAIVRVVRTDRRLSRRSANFWALVFGIPSDQVAALSA